MAKISKKRAPSWGFQVLGAVVVFVLVNLGVASLSGLRLDLTEDRLFTLSEGAKRVLETMPNSVQMTLYYSKRLGEEVPAFATYASRVEEMMGELADASDGKLSIAVIDPEPFSVLEDEAVERGMQGVPLGDAGDEVYFGLYIEPKGDGNSDVDLGGGAIPFLQTDRASFLEYDLTKMIWRAAHPEKAKVGVVSSKEVFGDPMAGMRGQPANPWYALVQAQDFFDLSYINSAEALIEKDPDILLIIHPKLPAEVGESVGESGAPRIGAPGIGAPGIGAPGIGENDVMDENLLYAIDQFLLRGGRAMIFLDPWNETTAGIRNTAPGVPLPYPIASNLDRLLNPWGITIPSDVVVGDRALGRLVNAGGEGQLISAPYPAWVQPKAEAMAQEDSVTAVLQEMLLPSPGKILVSGDAQVTVSPLITSSMDVMDLDPESLQVPDPRKILDIFEPDGDARILAARISGLVSTAFPDGPPVDIAVNPNGDPDTEEAASAQTQTAQQGPAFPPHIAESTDAMNVILVADADMLEDRYWVTVQNFFGQTVAQPFLDNGTFLVNGLENLNGSSDLLSLRARRTGSRPFERIDEIRRAAETEFRSEEQALQRRLAELEAQMAALEDPNAAPTAGEEAETTAAQYTAELVQTRQALRQVNANLRRDIETLESQIRLVNILGTPSIVVLAAILFGLYRRRQKRVA